MPNRCRVVVMPKAARAFAVLKRDGWSEARRSGSSRVLVKADRQRAGPTMTALPWATLPWLGFPNLSRRVWWRFVHERAMTDLGSRSVSAGLP
jgi:hypothetical protein